MITRTSTRIEKMILIFVSHVHPTQLQIPNIGKVMMPETNKLTKLIHIYYFLGYLVGQGTVCSNLCLCLQPRPTTIIHQTFRTQNYLFCHWTSFSDRIYPTRLSRIQIDCNNLTRQDQLKCYLISIWLICIQVIRQCLWTNKTY